MTGLGDQVEAYLDDEDGDGVLGIIDGGVGALEDASLRSGPQGAGRGGGGDGLGEHTGDGGCHRRRHGVVVCTEAVVVVMKCDDTAGSFECEKERKREVVRPPFKVRTELTVSLGW